MTIIVIPVADTNSKCKKWLEDCLQSYIQGQYKENGWGLVLCFDHCSPAFFEYFQNSYWHNLQIGLINNVQGHKRLGFAANVNTGLRHVHKQRELDCVVLNMDTMLPHQSYLKSLKNGGLSTAIQLHTNSIEELNKSQPSVIEKSRSLKFPGFCFYMSKPLMDKIGYLDETFRECFDDDDLCVRANLAGFPVEVININVHHDIKDRMEPSNTGVYTHEDLGKNLLRFRWKWEIPANIEHSQFNQWILDHHVWSEEMKCG